MSGEHRRDGTRYKNDKYITPFIIQQRMRPRRTETRKVKPNLFHNIQNISTYPVIS